jgi:hypothetical protein
MAKCVICATNRELWLAECQHIFCSFCFGTLPFLDKKYKQRVCNLCNKKVDLSNNEEVNNDTVDPAEGVLNHPQIKNTD